MRWVSTLVLPDPAPATTSSGPPRWTTASSWSGLSPVNASIPARSESALVSGGSVTGDPSYEWPVTMGGVIRLPEPCLVVLVGPAGCGKSTWAARSFRPDQIISSDRLRSMVGTGERDQRAGTAAFEVLDLVVDHRLRRRLTTVIDSTALEPAGAARLCRHGSPCGALPSSPPCSTSPSARCAGVTVNVPTPCPSAVHDGAAAQSLPARSRRSPTEGFDAVVAADDDDVVVVPPQLVAAPIAARRQQEDPMPLTFGLQVPRFTWPGGTAEIGQRLGGDRRGGRAGRLHVDLGDGPLSCRSPRSGREWDEMLEAYTTLGLPRRAHPHGAPRHAVHRHHLPQRRRPRQDRRHPRRAVRRTGDGRARHRLVRAGARALRLGLPARAATATPCSRTPSSCSRCCGARARRGSRGGRSPCPRRSATRVRCRSTSRSSSAVRANGARCASWPATPTRATCSATRRRCATRSRCCTGTAPTSTATPPR